MSYPVGALWKKKTKDGKEYMSGHINDMHGKIQLVVFEADKTGNEQKPDYIISVSEPQEQTETK